MTPHGKQNPVSDRRTAAAIERLGADRAHGASELARSVGVLLDQACERIARSSPGALPGRALLAAIGPVVERVRGLRPSMAPIGNAAAAFYAALEEAAATASDCRRQRPWRRVRRAIERRQRRDFAALIAAARSPLRGCGSILTLSRSSSVAAILDRSVGRRTRIIIAESRPGLEGRRMARHLIDRGRAVTCITDAQICLFAGRADAVLLGADTVSADLAVVNKVGSLAAALGARLGGRPVYAATETLKIAPFLRAAAITLEEKPGAEVWRSQAARCANVYFEPVPAELIAGYITEKGVLDAAGMAAEVTRLGALSRPRA